MKNQWLNKKSIIVHQWLKERLIKVDAEMELFEADYHTQVAQEKNEIRDILDKYRGHCWFDSFMSELGFCKGGFPLDDENSLQQWSAGSSNLDMFYNTQYIQHEKVDQSKGFLVEKITYCAEYTPIVAGTMTGTVTINGEPIQTFIVSSENVVTLTQTTNSSMPCMIAAELKLNTGEFIGYWDAPAENTELIVSYEYNIG